MGRAWCVRLRESPSPPFASNPTHFGFGFWREPKRMLKHAASACEALVHIRAETMNLSRRSCDVGYPIPVQENDMLKFIAQSMHRAADRVEAIDPQRVRANVNATSSKVVSSSAKGLLSAANAVAGFAQRYAK